MEKEYLEACTVIVLSQWQSVVAKLITDRLSQSTVSLACLMRDGLLDKHGVAGVHYGSQY